MKQRLNTILHELKRHAPFTALGTFSGVLLLGLLLWMQASRSVSATLFWILHPVHVLLSALVTAAIFRLHGGKGFWATMCVGYFGSVGIATFSDCLLPFVGEWLLALPHRGLHLGFVEKWWLVNPLAVAGIVGGLAWPYTRFPHAGHVLLSTWASLFHITIALGDRVLLADAALVAVFLFLSVWLPCCTSDIVFPLLFARQGDVQAGTGQRHWFHITGLSGWNRARHGLPAFGDTGCTSRPRPRSSRWPAELPGRRQRIRGDDAAEVLGSSAVRNSKGKGTTARE